MGVSVLCTVQKERKGEFLQLMSALDITGLQEGDFSDGERWFQSVVAAKWHIALYDAC